MSGRFDYVKYDEISIGQQAVLKQTCQELERQISNLGRTLEKEVPGELKEHVNSFYRSRATAITKLEECYAWVGKAIRDEQIVRNGSTPLQEERVNS